MKDLLNTSLVELTERIRSKSLSPVELMEATLARIETTQPRLNAMVSVLDGAALLSEARDAADRVQRGEARPLEGIPLAVKDLEDVAGLVTSHGSRAYRDHVAEHDSIQVERLRRAGAIVVGKTNTPEFGATAITKNPLFGTTRNPWDPERTPGGSSGGASAVIAGGVVPLATAGDGGGSIRIPASFTGCFGLKPSYGRVPRGPQTHWIMDDTATWGPLSRSVADAALHLDLVAGAHPLDPNSLPHPGLRYSDVLDQLPDGLRIGFSPDLGYGVVQQDIAEVVGDAAAVFAELGHEVELVREGPPGMGRDWGMIGAFELLGTIEPDFPERESEFGRSFLAGVKTGARMTPHRWAAARERREALNRWCATIFERFDLLLTPTVPYDPPPAEGPFPTEIDGQTLPFASVGTFTIPFNLSWHPAASVRAGFSKTDHPVGLQIVGPRHRDDRVLQAARAFERVRPWADRWPADA